MWSMGLLFLKTSPVKQCSYENDFSGVFDALHQSFLVVSVAAAVVVTRNTCVTTYCRNIGSFLSCPVQTDPQGVCLIPIQ